MEPRHSPRHFAHWPPDMPRSLRAPHITLQQRMFLNSSSKHPDKPAAIFEGKTLTYKELQERVENLAGHLQHTCGVRRGDRVLLDMQNGHDFVIACFAILLADAVVVPVSPMNIAEELRHYIEDSDARAAITEGELFERFSGLPLDHVVLLNNITPAKPKPSVAQPDDLCMMPYTSGSTGKPKGCMHTHATILHNVAGACAWKHIDENTVALRRAVFSRHRPGPQLVRRHLRRRHHGDPAALGPAGGRAAGRALQMQPLGQCADDGGGSAVAPEGAGARLVIHEMDLRRRRRDAGSDRAKAVRPVRRALH